MGRFYSGDIHGKFWFGIQNSNDINNLITSEFIIGYCWKECNCEVLFNNNEPEKYYCDNCYSSKDEHIKHVIENNNYEDELLYYESQEIIYHLNKSNHYKELNNNMNKLKLQIDDNIIQEMNNIKQTDDILNAFSGVFNNVTKLLNNTEDKKICEYVARYILGYQIQYCLNKNDKCVTYCEL